MRRRIAVAIGLASLATPLALAAQSPGAADARTIAPATAVQVYAAALGFYRPPFGRAFWLDENDLAGARVEPAVLSALRAGMPALRILKNGSSAAEPYLRVSPLEPFGPDAYRLTVRYRYVSEHFEGEPIDQWFVVRRTGDGWTIADRGPAAPGS